MTAVIKVTDINNKQLAFLRCDVGNTSEALDITGNLIGYVPDMPDKYDINIEINE